jgi:predicted RNA-binding protein YlxR (DUF448 family)
MGQRPDWLDAAIVIEEEAPRRRCAVTRERAARAQMVRFVVAPDGRIVADLAERLPGRGIWLTARRDVIERAVARGALAKAAGRPVMADGTLADQVERQLVRRCQDWLGLARRGGRAVVGFDQVADWLRAGRAALLVVAADAAAGQRARLPGRVGELPVIDRLRRDEIGAAFGREAVTYAALSSGGVVQKLRRDAARLAGMRAGPGSAAAGDGEGT